MRQKIIAGNWKMNLRHSEAQALAQAIAATPRHTSEVVLFPSFVYLHDLKKKLHETGIDVGAQNLSDRENGAFTGEVSAPMLASLDISSVLIGHSERRLYFHEDHETLKTKINIALQYGLRPFFCCGEPKEIRVDEKHERYVERQLEESLFHLNEEQIRQVVIAYEPVWAIGTGLTASPTQTQTMHAFIREKLRAQYGSDVAGSLRILYGGSVQATNAPELFAQPDVDGGLIGGASLKATEFSAIIQAAL